MAGEWQTITLRKAGVSLTDCDHRTPPAAEGGYPYVAIPQLRDGRIELNEARKITPQHFVEWTRKANPTENDVVLSRRCNPGETAFVPPSVQFALGQNLVLLRADGSRVHPPFLRWLTRGPEWWDQINKFINVGAIFNSLKCADIPKFELTIPPLDEQRAIAYILGTLDDKIELNRRINETLEAIARAIFKSWFVDFDPVRAKASGESPESICRRLGLTPDLLALFPDRLVDSELGEIPEGWVVRAVGDVIERLPVGKKYEQKTVKTVGKVPVLDQGKSGIIGFHDDEPGVVASTDRPVAVFANHTCYMRLIYFPFSAIQNVLPFIGKGVDTIWAFHVTFGKQSFIEYKGHWPDFLIHKIVVPEPDLSIEFSNVVHSMLKKIWSQEVESNTLATLRDTLLPKLISGELPAPVAGAA